MATTCLELHCKVAKPSVEISLQVPTDELHSLCRLWLMAAAHIFCPTDEVGGLVVDIGSYSARAGYAGEDTPKVCMVPGNSITKPVPITLLQVS